MIVAAHQPHYMPWLGYLDKLAKADLFVVMDDLAFVPGNFHNRQHLKHSDGAGWLSVPIVNRRKRDALIMEKQIAGSSSPKHHWQHQHWRTLVIHYGGARYFADYADELRDVYTRPWTSLIDLDLHMLGLARRWLRIPTPIVRSSQLGITGTKTERLIDLCRRIGARCYLTGVGGSVNYLDVEAMARAGIGVIWQHFEHPEYAQRYPDVGFVPRLGFLDLVLNCGPASRDILFDASHPIQVSAPAAIPSSARSARTAGDHRSRIRSPDSPRHLESVALAAEP
jgi:hypothetical protein